MLPSKANLIQPGTNGSYYQVPWVLYIYNVWPNVYWDSSFSTSAIGTICPTWAGITDPLTYSEQVPSPGIYYYVAVAKPGNIWSQPLQVNANPQALILYYTFDASSGNTVTDSSGNGNNGVLNGSGAWVAGKINNALKLDGSTSYVSLPGTILQSLSNFIVASWLYMTGWQNNQRLFDFGYRTQRCMWFSPTTCNSNSCNGSSTFQITYNGRADNTQLVNTPANLATNQWLHIAIVRYGNLTQLFVNGNVVSSNSNIYLQPFQLGLGTNNNAQYWIGRSQNDGDSHLSGIIDDFRLYQGALTSSQISALASMSGK